MSFAFLKTKPAILLTILLLTQAAMLFAFTQREPTPMTRPLSELPPVLGNWMKVQDGVSSPTS